MPDDGPRSNLRDGDPSAGASREPLARANLDRRSGILRPQGLAFKPGSSWPKRVVLDCAPTIQGFPGRSVERCKMSKADFRSVVTDSVRYWETSRVYYNLWLTGITLGCGWRPHGMQPWVTLLVLAAIANLLYCAAYPIDILVQFSDFRDRWRNNRYLLLLAGMGLAGMLAFLCTRVMFFGNVGI